MARKTKAEARATRESILDAAEDVMERDGIPATTLDQIAREAGVTRGAIYWHFKDKEDLLDSMVARAAFPLDELRAADVRAETADALEELRQVSEQALLRLAQDPRHQRVCRILLHGCVRLGHHHLFIAEEDAVKTDIHNVVLRLFQKARAQGTLSTDITPELATWTFDSYMQGVHSNWLKAPDQVDLAANARLILRTFLDGVRIGRPPH
ncbi:TetR family transcriptional regulator [Rhodovibrio salinarum]|uniref:TetR family transcriptional regulator n=1 Tax=Rhodovibrio salinarum TaxID=1087 RepID=A0A934QJU6_9PROT|nr:TetR family transcriptional regulator [Rhodovibrio salinarum]MBK1697770.1 TetR family transcriptional regulator [Rhodovibrio salinarum]